MKSALLSSSIIALATAIAAPALAQTAPAPAAGADQAAAEVIVTGTRQTGVKAVDSPAPIQLVGSAALSRTGQPDVMQALSQSLPSFNAQGYGADTAQLTLEAALRGLNPNQTLVMVDGKRRHGTANLQVDYGSPFQGAAAPDLSFIPVGAIDHIEVLQDGAAAQYGSDAIAGVLNVILKKNASGGSISATGGQYYEGDGDTGAWSINKGIALGDKGFFNVTMEERVHSFSRQGGCDRRISNPDCSLRSDLSAVNASGVTGAPGYPKMNNIYGDGDYNLYNLFYNAGYDITPDIQVYSYGNWGHRKASAFENYRVPSRVSGVTSTGATVYPFPHGFEPREQFVEDDYSFTGGVKGAVVGWNWDISSTYGKDVDSVYVVNSANASLFKAMQANSAVPIAASDIQRKFYDGAFEATEWTNNLDINRDFKLGFLASPLNVAFGGETRRDTFALTAGEPNSYYGDGTQSFFGYSPLDASSHARTSYAGYIDLAADIVTGLHVDAAARYEHYSDFGDTSIGKLTARYDFNPMFAVRGTISTGFRAPTPQEEYYEGINVSPSFIEGQIPPNSAAAKVGGFSPLRPEVSHNYSFGFVVHPMDRMQISADFYEIDIHKRIVGSAFMEATSYGTILSQTLYNVLAAAVPGYTGPNGAAATNSYTAVQLFTNGANTRTRGAEVTATYASDFGDMGHVDWSAGFNYNDTSIQKIFALPAGIPASASPTGLLSPTGIDALTKSTPKYKVVLAAYWTHGPWSVNLREDVYGPTSQTVSLNGGGFGDGTTDVKIGVTGITDLDVGYKVTRNLKIDAGANNLFDTKPTSVPNVLHNGHMRPADGNNVYGEPAQFSPFGINGGYYYGRVTYSF